MADAKRFLQQVKLYDSKINSLLEELDNLKAMVLKITTTLKQDVVSSGGNQDKIGDAIAKIVDLEAEINAAVDGFVNKKKAVNDAKDEISGMAMAIAEKVVGMQMNPDVLNKLFDEFMDELGESL
jgi:F-type H+-transporting ATPase subunit b